MAKPDIFSFLNIPVIAAEKAYTKTYTNKLRHHAVKKYGWSEDLASNLVMRHNGKRHGQEVAYLKNAEDAIHVKEHGDSAGTPPSPAIRSFIMGEK